MQTARLTGPSPVLVVSRVVSSALYFSDACYKARSLKTHMLRVWLRAHILAGLQRINGRKFSKELLCGSEINTGTALRGH